jgi:GNAT superfamily N-acetyltransferase
MAFLTRPSTTDQDLVYCELHNQQDTHVATCQLQDFQSPGAWLARVYVPEDIRGMGVGRRLVEHALEYCRAHGKKAVALSCLIENTVALQLYQSLGFVIVCYGKDNARYELVKLL